MDQAIEIRDATIASLRSALIRIAKGEEEIAGLAPKYYGHGISIALKALGLPARLFAEEVDSALIEIERKKGRR